MNEGTDGNNLPEVTFISQWPPDNDETESLTKSHKRKIADIDQEQPDNDPYEKRNVTTHANSSQNSSCDVDDQEHNFLWALPSIARWWRKQVAKEKIIYKGVTDSAVVANTKLKRILKRSDCQLFIEETIQKLQAVKQRYELNAHYFSALASFFDTRGDYTEALNLIERSLQVDQKACDALWLKEKISRAHFAQRTRERLLAEHSAFQKSQMLNPLPIERRSAKDLSFKEFLSRYALQAKPVIITDAVCNMISTPWTFEHIKNVAGDRKAAVKRLIPDSVEWARLEIARSMTVKEFVNNMDSPSNFNDEQLLYLFDWSLPLNCPELASELTIPKYFASDFLQRTPKGTLYHDSWPSLFIAPEGARSELHIDAFGSNFWMALFQGRKRWLIFRREDLPLLYPSYFNSLDGTFNIDLSSNDDNFLRALSLCKPRECILQPGELLFVPSGCPHRVENLERSIAISANFVDLSNYHRVVEELEYSSMMDNESKVLLSVLTDSKFSTRMNSQQDNLAWKDFKNWQSLKSNYDFDITLDNIKNFNLSVNATES
ncbi:F-box protein [Trichoplax sp. H2]|nr:F-box protein [Trichoplax sp. H2]|eukprot:RDD43381.1 F-box protein [Trichoplax sp. H2]